MVNGHDEPIDCAADRPVRRAQTVNPNPLDAVAELSRALYQEKMAGVIFFCSDEYDLDILSQALKEHFDCPIVGCTTAGEIGENYQQGGLVGLSFSSECFCFHPIFIDDLSNFTAPRAYAIEESLQSQLKFSSELNPKDMFGLFLIDGLSVMEELVMATLNSAMKGIPTIGGSAGDGLKFSKTQVYDGQAFRSNIASFILVESKLSFQTFKLQHFEPSDNDMVITLADSKTRTVYEIDGGPAAEEYAEILGVEITELTSQVFSQYPVMLQIGKEWYVRAIQKMNEDGSLTFYCAIDEGLPLTVAKGVGYIETLTKKVDELQEQFSDITCTLGFDCILRKLEMQNKGIEKDVAALLRRISFSGFSTYGEQYGAIHVNQTLTGVVIGSRRA